MLWQKSWWETRKVFGVALIASLSVLMITRPWQVPDLVKWMARVEKEAEFWGVNAELIPALNSYYGHLWHFQFKLMMPILWPWMAAVMGITLLYSSATFSWQPSSSAQYTLALPVTRRKILLTHAAVLAAGMTGLAVLPSLLTALIYRANGAWVPLSKVVTHGLLLGWGGLAFPMLGLLFTVMFKNPLGSIFTVSAVGALCFLLSHTLGEHPWWHIFHLMTGDTYFRYGQIPWLALLFWLSLAAVFLWLAVRIYERRDF